MTIQRPPLARNKLAMLISCCGGASLLHGVAYAQDPAEEILVTGSRITRSTMETPTPVTVMSGAELQSVAPANLIDGLSQLPHFYANQNPEQVNGGQNSGGSNVNLRGAGANRTLTLLNGHRVVSSNRFGTPDVSLFPKDLLRSVEIVTGGASASYGTDAVAGVVNFLLDTGFEGFKTRGQMGASEYGDGESWEAGFAFGANLTERLHIIGSVSRFDQDAISDLDGLRDRDWVKQLARISNPDPNGPTELVRPYVSPTNFTATGVIVQPTSPALNRLVFRADGTAAPLAFSGLGNLNGGCLCQAEPTQTFGVNGDDEIQNAYERDNAYVYLDYDIGASTNVYLETIFGDNSASDRRESISLLSLWQGRLYADNAFLAPSVASLMAAQGTPGDPSGVRYVGYGYFPPNNADTVLGDSRQDTDNTTHATTIGFTHDFEGDALSGWRMYGYYQSGDSTQDFVTRNGVRVDRLQLAMDAVIDPATGQPVCRVNLPQFTGPIASGGNGGVFADCVPLNTFGGVANITPQAANFVMDRDHKIARQWTEQRVAEVTLSGNLWEGFGAGPIGSAFGVSWREEEFDQRTLDPADEFPALTNGTLLSDLGLLPAGIRGVVPQGGGPGCVGLAGIPGLRFVPTGYCGDQNSSSVLFSSLRAFGGGYDVREAFAELNIPVLSDVRLVDNLEISTAARWADYSGSGDIQAWKLSANWSVNDQLRVRATRSRDVRAATLRERYDQTRGGINVNNPWNNNALVSAASLSGGNPNVSPEEADTYTAGIVFQPPAAENLSLSLDWYSIDISEALAQLNAQNIVNGCRGGDLSLCQYVISGSGPVADPFTALPIPIDRVESLFINLNNQRIRGVDFEMSYRLDFDALGGSALGWRFLATRLMENSIQTAGSPFKDDRAGQLGGLNPGPLPEYRVTSNFTYTFGRYSVFLQARWIDGGLLDRTYLESSVPVPAAQRPVGSFLVLCNTNTTICTLDDNTLPSATYVDLRLAAKLGSEQQLELFANVNNLLDEEPVVAAGAVGRTGVALNANSSLYDVIGRRLTVGVSYSF
jgi:outer membrane receptor protein involved in Fe transport